GVPPLPLTVALSCTVLPAVTAITTPCTPLWISVLIVGAKLLTVTVLPQLLFCSLLSVTLLFGSTAQVPSTRGLVSEPEAVAVTVNCAPKVPPTATTTVPPLAVQVSVLLAIAQLIVPVMPLAFTTLAAPEVAPVVGRLSVMIVCPDWNVAGPLPPLLTVSVHLKLPPTAIAPFTSFVLLIARSGAFTITMFGGQLLFCSLVSDALLFGSTEHTPFVRGFVRLPAALGVTVNCAPKLPAAAIVTLPPLAVQVSVLLAIAQATVPVMPLGLTTLTAP